MLLAHSSSNCRGKLSLHLPVGHAAFVLIVTVLLHPLLLVSTYWYQHLVHRAETCTTVTQSTLTVVQHKQHIVELTPRCGPVMQSL